MSSIDPRQAAFRAAEEARRRAAEEARRRAAERAREEARARELAQKLSAALESRKEPATKEVARVLKDAEALGPEARSRFLEEMSVRARLPSGPGTVAEAVAALEARIAEVFPEASDGRQKLGAALLELRGEALRGRTRESLESLVSETVSRLGITAKTAAVRTATPSSADRLERAPDVSLFGGGPRPAGTVAGGPSPEPRVEIRPPGGMSPRAEEARRDLRRDQSAARASTGAREGSVSRPAPSVQSPPSIRTPAGPEAVRARAVEVALDREDLAAALGMGRAQPSPTEAPPAEAARLERAEVLEEAGEGFFSRARPSLVLTPSMTEAVVAPGVRAVGGSLELAVKSLGRAREAIADGRQENVRVQYGLKQAGGFFEKIAARLKKAEGLVAGEVTPKGVGVLRQVATAARGELRQVQLDAGEARAELGDIAGWAKRVGVKGALREVAELTRAARRGEGELRLLGGRAAVLESLPTAAVQEGEGKVRGSEGTVGIPPHRRGEKGAPPDLDDVARPAGVPADFSFGEEDLARIGTGLDPSRPPPQNYWNEQLVNEMCNLGREQGAVSDAEGHGHLLLARQLLEGAEGQAVELGAAEIAVALKAAGIPLEKVDPNQLHSAARYVSTATNAADQHDKLRKTLENFQVLTTIGAPSLTKQQMVEQLWVIAKVPGHALEKLSTTELQGKYQEIVAATNAGPGQHELKVGKHNLKFTVGENGQVTQSETKKPGFFSKVGGFLKKVAPIALTVASFIPFTAPFARIAQGAISLVKAIRSKSLLGAVTSAAGMVAGGAAAIAGRVADGAASAASTVARIANGAARGLQGVSSLRQGSLLGGIAALGSGVASAIGQVAEGASTGLQRFANRLGDTSAKLSYAARGMGIVDGYRAASAAVNEARVALRQAEASGDPAAIAAARQQLQAAEKAKTSALLGGAASAAGLAADVRADHTIFPGEARDSPIPQSGLDQALRGASRGLGVAQGVQSGDYAAAGVNALGLAAVGDAALGGAKPDQLGLTDAANMADAGLAYHQTNVAVAAADQVVADAEAALQAARRSGDAAAIQAAQVSLDQARKGREGALMGAIAAGDSLVLTAAQIGQKFDARRQVQGIDGPTTEEQAALKKEEERALATWKEADEQERIWRAQAEDESLSPQEREAALAGILALHRAKDAYNAAIKESGVDPEKLNAATVAFENLQAQIETEVKNRASAPAYAAMGDPSLSPTPPPRPIGIATVERGMTVWEISQRTGVPVDRILEFNAEQGNAIDPRKLQVGQKVLVPMGADDIQFTARSVEEVRAMQWAELERRRLAALEAPKVHSPEVPFVEGEVDVRASALAGLSNDRAFLVQDEEESRFRLLNPSTWVDTDIDDAKNKAREVFRDAVDRLEALARDPNATDAEIYAAQQYKNQAQLAFNGARGAVLDGVREADFLTPVQEVVQEAQDAVHAVTGSAADWIEETGAPAPLVAAATLPLHIVDSVVDLDAGIVKGATQLVSGVAGFGVDLATDPWETTKGAASLIDRAAQTTLGGQAVEFLAEAAFGKYDSLDDAVRAWQEKSNPLKLAQSKWDFTTDVGKAMLAESVEAWKQGKYSEAVGVFLGQNVDMLLGAGILKAGRAAGVTKVVDGAADAQKVVGATTKAGRALDATGDVARTADAAKDAGKAADAVVDATRGATTPKPAAAANVPDAAKVAAPSASVEGTRVARAADAASDVGRTADVTGDAARATSTTAAPRATADTAADAARASDKTVDAAKAVDGTADSARAASAAQQRAPRQVTGDLDELYRHAAAAQDDLAAATRSIAEATGGKPMIPGLKGRERALEKIAADYGGDASRITDLARSSIVYDRVDDLYRALDRLQDQYKVLRVKDRIKAPLEDGYRDVLVNVEMPNGHIVEMQFHLDEIMRVKNGPGHALYEEIRSTRAAAFRENRPHTAAELQKIEAAQEKSRKLYDDAAARAGAPIQRGISTAEAAGRTSGGQEVSSIGRRGGTSGDDGVNLLDSKQVQPRPDGVEFRGFRGGGGRPADRAYATQVSGGAEKAVYVNGVEFDSVRGGVLIDAKRASAKGSFYDISGTDRFTQRVKIPAIVDQAKRQLAAVRGQKFKGIEWQVSNLQVARQLQALLLRQGLRIKVVHTPKKG